MKGIKTATAFLFAALLCLCVFPKALADDPLELHMEGVTVTDGGLTVYCNSNAEELPRSSDFSVTLGNTSLNVKDVSLFAETSTGTSYIFLADVSGSIKQSQLQSIKDTLTLICAGLATGDNVSIFAIGNETYTQPFVSEPDDILGQIDAIEQSNEDTNLYESVVKALSVLNTNENCHEKKVLVVFSDGEDDILQGITLDEASIKIKDSHIPIYTIAMIGSNPAQKYVESAKVLGSFARLSAGGRHYIHTLNASASEEIAGDILDSIMRGMAVSVDLSGFSSDGGEMLLRLELTVAGVGTASDGYLIPTAGLSSAVSPQPPAESNAHLGVSSSPETQDDNDDEPSDAGPNLLIRIACGAVALLLVIIVILLLNRRRKPVTPPVAVMPEVKPAPVRSAPPLPPPGKPRISLRLTKIGLIEEQVFRAEFAGQITIGRDASKAALCFKSDDLLSARHCSLSYEAEGIILRDLGSTNGTFVNGVPIKDRFILENDDILLIGSMELRVNWETLKI